MCQVSYIFIDFERDLSFNMLNEKLLWQYHEKLMFHLEEIFLKSALDCFWDTKLHHKRRDSYTGETWCVSFSDQIEYETKIKIDEFQKKGFGAFKKKSLLIVKKYLLFDFSKYNYNRYTYTISCNIFFFGLFCCCFTKFLNRLNDVW